MNFAKRINEEVKNMPLFWLAVLAAKNVFKEIDD